MEKKSGLPFSFKAVLFAPSLCASENEEVT